MCAARGVFVTGTNTGVGKTAVAAALVRILKNLQVDAVGFKPVATGAENGIWADAQALHEAADGCEPLEVVCPVRYKAPLAPTLAARREGLEADLRPARQALQLLCERHQAVVIEGVGGLLAPLDPFALVADFAESAGFPVLVVCTAELGTINHTLLTLRELKARGLPLAGVIMNVTRAADAETAPEVRGEIERIAELRILAAIPPWQGARDGLHAHVMESLSNQVDARKLLNVSTMRNS